MQAKEDCLKTIQNLNEELKSADQKLKEEKMELKKMEGELQNKDALLDDAQIEKESLIALVDQLEVRSKKNLEQWIKMFSNFFSVTSKNIIPEWLLS